MSTTEPNGYVLRVRRGKRRGVVTIVCCLTDPDKIFGSVPKHVQYVGMDFNRDVLFAP